MLCDRSSALSEEYSGFWASGEKVVAFVAIYLLTCGSQVLKWLCVLVQGVCALIAIGMVHSDGPACGRYYHGTLCYRDSGIRAADNCL
jgi:hypothetical protein